MPKTERETIPEIARFNGIGIKVFSGDHPPLHFYVLYGEHLGDLPRRVKKLAQEWDQIGRASCRERV